MRWAQSYSIIDHQILHGRYLHRLSHEAMALYLFLVVVGDRQGRSFYADRSITEILRLSGPRLHQTRGELIQEGLISYRKPYWEVKNLPLEQEQTLLIPLPAIDYDTRILASVKSSSQGLIKFESNRYSVPFTHANKMLTLKADAQEVWIYEQQQLIAQHRRSLQKYQLIENPRHPQGLLPSRPKGAYFKHRDLLLTLGDGAQHYLAALGKTELHLAHQLKKIAALFELFGPAEVKAALEQALAYNAFGHDYLKNIILANRRKRNTPSPLGTPSSRINPDLVRYTWVEERNPKIYDDRFQTEEPDHES